MAEYQLDEWSGFFNAMLVNGEYDRVYNAEHFASYFANFISSGVFADPSDQLKVSANEGLTVSIKAGKSYIKGYAHTLKNDGTITFSPNLENTGIIDKVVVEYLPTERIARIRVIENASSVLPDNEYQLVLCSFTLPVGASEITDAMITDRRPDKAYCGFVTGLIQQIDFKTLMEQEKAQFQEWFDDMKGQLSEDAAGNLQTQIDALGIDFQMKINEMMQKAFLQAVYIGQCAWTVNEILKWGMSRELSPISNGEGTLGHMAVYRPGTNTWEKIYRYSGSGKYNGTLSSFQWLTCQLDLCRAHQKSISEVGYTEWNLGTKDEHFCSFEWFSKWFPIGVSYDIIFSPEDYIFTVSFTYEKYYKEGGKIVSPWGKAFINLYDAGEDGNITPSYWSLGAGGNLRTIGNALKGWGNKPDVSGNISLYDVIFFRAFVIDWAKLFPREFLENPDNGYIEKMSGTYDTFGMIYGKNFNWNEIPYNNVIQDFAEE